MAAAVAGPAIPPATLRTIVETAGGNPLFLEQMLAMLQDAPDGDVTVPPTISALLSARLDRLGDTQREVVGTASVVGQVFPEAAVVELVPDTRRPRVPDDLGGLQRRRLLQPHAAVMTTGPAFAFQHILIRDTAYGASSSGARGAARAVRRLGRRGERRPGREYEEILGYHLEQAHGYLAELGPLDEQDAGSAQTRRSGCPAGRRASPRRHVRRGEPARRALAGAPRPTRTGSTSWSTGEAQMDVGALPRPGRRSPRRCRGRTRRRCDSGRCALIRPRGVPLGEPQRMGKRACGTSARDRRFRVRATTRAWRRPGASSGRPRDRLRYGRLRRHGAGPRARPGGRGHKEERLNASSSRWRPLGADARARGDRGVRGVVDATGDRRSGGWVHAPSRHLEAMRGSGTGRASLDGAREIEELGNSVLAVSTSLEAGRSSSSPATRPRPSA